MSLPGRRATNQKGEPITTQRFKRLSHSRYECKYHIVFCPKYRYRIFKEAIGEYAKQQVYQLRKQKEQVEVLELNAQPDHAHLVVSIPPKYAVSEFMGKRQMANPWNSFPISCGRTVASLRWQFGWISHNDELGKHLGFVSSCVILIDHELDLSARQLVKGWNW